MVTLTQLVYRLPSPIFVILMINHHTVYMSAKPIERYSIKTRILLGVCRVIYRPVLRLAAMRGLKGRLRDPEDPQQERWVKQDIKKYLSMVWGQVDELTPRAGLDELPSVGNRHNVFLAVMTTGAYRSLLDLEVSEAYARSLMADIGWLIYSWMLRAAGWPFRVLFRDPGKRMEMTLRALMIFPFDAPGKPGYEVEVWTEGSDTFTHWTHCPPQAYVRNLVDEEGNRGELLAFYHSWCQYDWPGADLLASDGESGHYTREHTMSCGDNVCDMCWHGQPVARDRR